LDRLFPGFCSDNIITNTLEQMRLDQRSDGIIFNE